MIDFGLIIDVSIFSFIAFVLFKSISSFSFFYNKNLSLIDNRVIVFFASIVFSLIYGFIAISGSSPDSLIGGEE